MKKIILSIFFLLSITIISFSQPYDKAIGARLGAPFTASYKHFFSEYSAVEGNFGVRPYSNYRWTTLNAAYQLHLPLNIRNIGGTLRWYVGLGGGVYLWNFRDQLGDGQAKFNTSIQGYIGLDYVFYKTPVNLSVDWVPSYFFGGFNNGFGGGFGALSIRYTLNESYY